MATVYYADNYATPTPSGAVGAIQAAPFLFTVKAALVVNDTIKLVQLASGGSPGFNLFGIRIDIPDLDTGGTAIKFQLGDSTAADRYMTTTLAGVLGTVAAGSISSFGPPIAYVAATSSAGIVWQSLPSRYDAQDDLILKVQTAPTTSATSGVITGYILYSQLGISPFTAV